MAHSLILGVVLLVVVGVALGVDPKWLTREVTELRRPMISCCPSCNGDTLVALR